MSTDTTHPLFNSYDPYADPAPPMSHRPSDPWPQAQRQPSLQAFNRSNSGTLQTWETQYDTHGFSGSDDRLRAKESAGMVRPSARAVKARSRFRQMMATYNSFNQIAFMSIILVQTLSVLALIAAIYQTVSAAEGDVSFTDATEADPKLQTVATYVGIFILSQLFEIGITLDALAQKNIVQLILLVFFQVAMTTYSAFLPSQLQDAIVDTSADDPTTDDHVRGLAVAIACIIGVSTAIMSQFVWRLFNEFGWAVFKWLGADRQLKKFYQVYQVFVCLLKFDAFFFAGFTLQFLVLVDGSPTAEKIITIIAMPVTLVVLVLAAIAVRQESRSGVYAWLVVLVAGMAYFLYKLVRIYQQNQRYETAKKTLTIFGVVSFLMIVATFVLSGLCMGNFDRGLKERMPNDGWHCFGGRGGKSRKGNDEAEEQRMELD